MLCIKLKIISSGERLEAETFIFQNKYYFFHNLKHIIKCDTALSYILISIFSVYKYVYDAYYTPTCTVQCCKHFCLNIKYEMSYYS